MSKNIFKKSNFQFPYNYTFPGQASDEKILFVARESKILLLLRLFFLTIICLAIGLSGILFGRQIKQWFDQIGSTFTTLTFIMASIFFLIGAWWIKQLYKKSIVIVTTHRLTKFVYTTPFNRHNLSLPLEMIVDTGSYSKGFLQAMFNLGTFTARSSAASSGVATDDSDRINKKYFYITNVSFYEDLQHYINKLLGVFRTKQDQLHSFRPFIPHLKGEKRKEFMKKYPQYWS